MVRRKQQSESFTLAQVIMIVSIIAVSTAVIIFSLDPMVQLRASRNRQRWTEVATIAYAIDAYRQKYGELPSGLDRTIATVQIIGTDLPDCAELRCSGEAISWASCSIPRFSLELSEFVHPVPIDPLYGSVANAYYFVNVDRRDVVTVGACREEPEDAVAKDPPPEIKIVF